MNTVRFCYTVAAAAFMSLAVSSFEISELEATADVTTAAPTAISALL